MDQTSAHLALDISVDSVRALLGILHRSPGGCRLEVHPIERAPSPAMKQVGVDLWDIEGVKRGIVNCLRSAHRHAASRGVRLRTVGITAPGPDFGLLNADGLLMSPPRMGPHPRHGRAPADLDAPFAAAERFAMTGIAPARTTTLSQIRALEQSAPGAVARAATVSLLPDLLHELLAGVRICERSAASASELLDLNRRDWSETLLASAGVSRAQVPDLSNPCSPIGPLVRDLGGRAGITDAIEVVPPPSTPLAAAAAGVALAEESPAFLLVGDENTVAIERSSAGQVLGPGAFNAGVSNHLTVDGHVLVTRAVCGLSIVSALRRDLRARGRSHAITHLAAMAASAGPSPLPIDLEDPSLDHPRSGDADTVFARIDAQLLRRGAPAAIDPAAAIRACLDGFALSLAEALRAVRSATGERIPELVVGANRSGGSSDGGPDAAAMMQEPVLLGLLAQATGCRVHAGPFEPTLIGNILCQALGIGLIADRQEARGILRAMTSARRYDPAPEA